MMKSTLGVTFNNFTILACVLNLHTFYQLWLDISVREALQHSHLGCQCVHT